MPREQPHGAHSKLVVSRSHPFNQRPSLRIVDFQPNSIALFCDQNAPSVRIIVDFRFICQRKTEVAHVRNTRVIPPDNHISRDAVAALPNSARHSIDRHFRRWEPEVEKANSPFFALALFQKTEIRLARASRLECEAMAITNQISHPFNHQATSCKSHSFRVARRQNPGYFVRVQIRV